MKKRIFKNNLIHKNDIIEELFKIPESISEYVTKSGIVYKKYNDEYYYIKKPYLNKHNGYMYLNITIANNMVKTVRFHRILAKVFLENPNNYNIVGHKNNIKNDNRLNNLYWTNISENTQKAFDDGLIVNDQGYDDSQSLPIYVFNLNKQLIASFGSISLASKEYKITKTTISRQANHKTINTPRCGYYFRFQDEFDKYGFIL